MLAPEINAGGSYYTVINGNGSKSYDIAEGMNQFGFEQ
jgi:hypothetical protein